jgi:hypothetical protein
MAYTLAQQPLYTPSPQMVIRLSMVMGLLAIVYALTTKNLIAAVAIAALPAVLLFGVYCIQHPRIGLAVYFTTSYFLTVFSRYTHTTGWSVVLDVLLVIIFFATLAHAVIYKGSIRWINGFNIMTSSYILWFIFVLMALAHTAPEEHIMAIRAWLLGPTVLYLLVSILFDNLKALRVGFIILGIFTIIATLKGLFQKFIGFDSAELIELYQGGGIVTHFISSGIRYFSIFSDAGNFGIHMGMLSIVYFIIAFTTTDKRLRLFYLSISMMAAFNIFLSGTRSAIVVPIAGFALFTLLSLKPKVMISTATLGALVYIFFAFTTIGNSSSMIRRMRTAFMPDEDASYNVRAANRKRVADYLKLNPWGAGLRGKIPITVERSGELADTVLPPDSYFVRIWIETGTGGLILHIAIYTLVLLRCCYVVMFLIRNQRLRLTMAALLSGVFGMLVNGYAGEAMGMPPNNFLIPAMLAFVLNGPYIDKTECTPTPVTINT